MGFRVLSDAATLKHRPRTEAPCWQKEIPRPQRRGHIEAGAARSGVLHRGLGFRVLSDAATLKR